MVSPAQTAIDHAALSGHFSPKRFLYDAGDQTEAVLRQLAPLCHEVVKDGQILWRMRNSDRLKTLKSLMRNPARLNKRQRKRGPTKNDVFAQVLEACIRDKTTPKIKAFIEAKGNDILGDLREALSATITARSVVSDKRRTALKTFELNLLRASVEHSERARQKAVLPSKLCGRVAEGKAVLNFLHDRQALEPIETLNSTTPPRSLLILGSPGMGKSAFLADLSDRIRKQKTKPWVLRFDFDQMTLLHGDTIAWTEEATRQLGDQIRPVAERLGDVRRKLAHMRAEASTEGTLSATELLMDDTIAALANEPQRPMVVLLDTIEEVVLRNMREDFETAPDSTLFRSLVDWVERLSALNGPHPVHVIYSGRIPPPIAKQQLPDWFDAKLQLPELENTAAADLLGIFDPNMPQATRDALVTALGGHPLHLILVQKHLRNLNATERAEVIRELADEKLQGLKSKTVMQTLYTRFLDRIRIKNQGNDLTSDMIKKLAHPGLLLREVTLETLTKIIAPAVGVTFANTDAAAQAFRILRDQIWLVNSAPGSDTITHRPDVRRVMLPMMLGSDTPDMRKVLRAAIKAYDAKGDFENAGYLRALSGQVDWLLDKPELAQSVVNKAGQEELDLLLPNIRAALKFYADQSSELSDDEISVLPEPLQDSARIAASAKMVRKTGARSSASAAKRQSGRADQPYTKMDHINMLSRLKGDVQTLGQSGDAYAVLNHRHLQSEIQTAFVEADFDTVADLGWHAVEQIETWPELNRPFSLDKPFQEHWLWLLTLASIVSQGKARQRLQLFDTLGNGSYKALLRATKPNDFSAAIFDLDMLRGTIQSTSDTLDQIRALRFNKLQFDIDLGFRGHRLLSQSQLAKRTALNAPVTLAVNAVTQSFLAPEFKQLTRSKRALTALRVDYHYSKSNTAKIVGNLFKYLGQKTYGRTTSDAKLYQDFTRSRRIDSSQSIPLSYIPIGNDSVPQNILDRVARGQTPELHDTIAGLLANEVPRDNIAHVLTPIAENAPFWPETAMRRIDLLSDPKGSQRERHDAAVELTRFADLCGLLNPLVKNMMEVTSSHRVENVAKLLHRLDHLWTWPAAST